MDELLRREFRAVSRLKVSGGAWRGGLRDGDQVVAVNGVDGRMDGSVFRLYFKEPGTRYTVRIRRGGVERDVVAELDPVAEGGPFY
jgi:S1-C subfamily serine protease